MMFIMCKRVSLTADSLFYTSRRVISATSSSRTIAPMTEAMSVPSVPKGIQPTNPASQPPSTPPMMPTIRLMIKPAPLPLTMRFAIHPATSPMSRYHNRYISFRFCFLPLWACKRCAKVVAPSDK